MTPRLDFRRVKAMLPQLPSIFLFLRRSLASRPAAFWIGDRSPFCEANRKLSSNISANEIRRRAGALANLRTDCSQIAEDGPAPGDNLYQIGTRFGGKKSAILPLLARLAAAAAKARMLSVPRRRRRSAASGKRRRFSAQQSPGSPGGKPSAKGWPTVIVGVPKEIKRDEYRVALLPVGVEELVRAGHQVLVEQGAGLGSGLADADYQQAGAELVAEPAEVFARAEMIVKVKEPLPAEWPLLRPGQIVFTYFHFAADRRLTEAVLASGVTAVAYETLRDDRGRLPLLTPMSEVAGRMSIQEGAKYLERPQMGRGILLGGVPGVAPAHITILGGGIVGANAAKVAAGFGADICLLDINMDRLRYLDDVMPANVDVLFSDRHTIREQLSPGRPGDRRRADSRGQGAAADRARRPGADEAGQRDHRRGDRSRGLRRNQPAHDAQRADLHRRRSAALLRDQHARRRRPHQHLCPVQRDAALGAGDRQPGHPARPPKNCRRWPAASTSSPAK